MSRIGIFAPVYDRLTARAERGRLGQWRRLAWEAVPSDGRGLEIGSGTGVNFPYYPPEAEVIAIELSRRMLATAARKQRPSGTALIGADVTSLPFRDRSFDWAIATLVFCEVPDPVAGLSEVRRVLLPGGGLVLLEHVRPGGWRGTAAALATRISGLLLGEHFDRKTEEAVKAAGFSVEHRRYVWRDIVVLMVARAPG